MKGKIAVEKDLTPVKDYLSHQGYNVECIDFNQQSPAKLRGYDAIVVTGMDESALGIEDPLTKSVVINADGLTPEQVADELKENHR